MKNIVIYIHGKGGSAAEAGHYKPLFPGSEVIGFDYHAQSPWEATEEFPRFFAGQRGRCGSLTLIANSIGAFFSMSSLDESLVDRAFLISPVVDMEKLIGNMMMWANVTEAELSESSRSLRHLVKGCHGDIFAMSVSIRSPGAFPHASYMASMMILPRLRPYRPLQRGSVRS